MEKTGPGLDRSTGLGLAILGWPVFLTSPSLVKKWQKTGPRPDLETLVLPQAFEGIFGGPTSSCQVSTCLSWCVTKFWRTVQLLNKHVECSTLHRRTCLLPQAFLRHPSVVPVVTINTLYSADAPIPRMFFLSSCTMMLLYLCLTNTDTIIPSVIPFLCQPLFPPCHCSTYIRYLVPLFQIRLIFIH